MTLCYYDMMLLWYYDARLLWYYDIMIFWYFDIMILWYYEIMIGLPGGARSRQAQRFKKTLCRTELLSHVILTRSQCHTAAAEGAKLSTIWWIKKTCDMMNLLTSRDWSRGYCCWRASKQAEWVIRKKVAQGSVGGVRDRLSKEEIVIPPWMAELGRH